jgi:hypothetical protein
MCKKGEGIDNFSLWNEIELSSSLDQEGHWKAELKGISSIVFLAVLYPYMYRISTEIILPCVTLNVNWNKINLKVCDEALLSNCHIFWTVPIVLPWCKNVTC